MDKKALTKIAAAGVGLVAVAGIAIASPSLAANLTGKVSSQSSTPSATGAPNFGMGGDNDGHGHGMRGGFGGWGAKASTQTVTVNVPNDGKSYLLVVTDSGQFARSEAVPVTGTGAVTVTLPPMHPGKFTLKLVAVSGSSVSGEIGTDGKLVAPITVG